MISVTCVQYTFKLYTDPWHIGLARTEVYKAEDVPKDGNIIFCDLEEGTTYYYKIELLKHCTDDTGLINVWTTATTYGSFTTDWFGFGEIDEWQYQCLGQPYNIVVSWDFDTSQIVPADEGLTVTCKCFGGTKEVEIPDEYIVQGVGNDGVQHCEVALFRVHGKFNFIIRGHVGSADYLTIEVVIPIENVEVEEEMENGDIVEP